MDKVIVAPVGDRPDAIFPALREFTVEHVHMLTTSAFKEQAEQLRKDLDKFGIPYSERAIGDNLWEDTFTAVSEFAASHPHRERIIVHVGVGDRTMQCAATTAAFVNGLHAVNGDSKYIMGLPVMRFSYYKLLNDRKMRILKALQDGPRSMNELAEDLRMSLSLLSYHVHGNRKSEGLVDMGLAELEDRKGQVVLHPTSMGRLLVKGSVPQAA